MWVTTWVVIGVVMLQPIDGPKIKRNTSHKAFYGFHADRDKCLDRMREMIVKYRSDVVRLSCTQHKALQL